MRSFFVAFLSFALFMATAQAQRTADQRAVNTKIADLLATIPEQNQEQLDKNMAELLALGKDARLQMLSMFTPEAKGDNTQLEYAFAGLAAYVRKDGREKERSMLAAEYCDALNTLNGVWTKEFILRQLLLIATNDQVKCLTSYLADTVLADVAARALSVVGTPDAKSALLSAFAGATSTKLKLSLVEALGYSQNATAVPVIEKLAAGEDGPLKKVSLHALAEIALPSSADILQAQAAKTGYRYDNTGATAAYFRYIRELSRNGKKAEAEKLAATLMTQITSTAPAPVRSAALAVFTEVNGEKSLPQLYKAMQDKDAEYRDAALDLAAAFQSPDNNKQLLKTMSKASPEAKVQIVEHLAETGDASLAASVGDLLAAKDTAVRKAAIDAYATLGKESALPKLMQVLKSGTASDVHAVEKALLVMKGDAVAQTAARSLVSLPPKAQTALLEVLAARRAEQSAPEVTALAKSNDPAVKRAAMQTLGAVARQQDLPMLFDWLNTLPDDQVNAVQQAILSASESMDTAQRATLFTSKMESAAAGKKRLYLELLAQTGGRLALQQLQNAYTTGDAQTKKSAVEALSSSTDPMAPEMLLTMSRSASDASLKSMALNAFISRIGKAKIPGAQKLLLLREAMPLATEDKQRRSIVSASSNCNTFLALVFAGDYLGNAEVQDAAAQAVINLCLNNKDFTGATARSLLEKTLTVLKGQESEYQREAVRKHLAEMPAEQGFVPMFNGKDLTGWQGLVENPIKRDSMTANQLAKAQQAANEKMKKGWEVKDGLLIFKGEGDNLSTTKKYGNFEMLVDWKITEKGDAGIYLRGTPQVQIWDTSRRDVGAEVGSGGLYNNEKNPSKPLMVADNAIGEWNTFHIIMKGDGVTVYLNGKLVTDSVVLENYWNRKEPIFPSDYIELQAHGTYVAYRNLYIKELPGSGKYQLSADEKAKGYEVLFDGTNLDKWTGNKTDYRVDNGELLIKPRDGGHGNLYTQNEYSDFVFRFEFQLTPGANNGLGIRAPLEGDAAYEGMEIQILDNEADIYKDLKPYQYHGSVYGVIPAKRGFLKPTGEWNDEEVTAKGSKIKVVLNGETILDGDIKEARKNGTMDHLQHPGLKNQQGHIGFLGHGSMLRFRNIRVLDLKRSR